MNSPLFDKILQGMTVDEAIDALQREHDEGSFKRFYTRLLAVDPNCTVEENRQDMSIRVRPSHPWYRDELARTASYYRPLGVKLLVIREVDENVVMDLNGALTYESCDAGSRLPRWFLKIFEK